MSKRDEAAYEALGMLEALLEGGDLPACVVDIAREIVAKANADRAPAQVAA